MIFAGATPSFAVELVVVVCGFIRPCGDATGGAAQVCCDDAHPGGKFDGGGDGGYGEGQQGNVGIEHHPAQQSSSD